MPSFVRDLLAWVFVITAVLFAAWLLLPVFLLPR